VVEIKWYEGSRAEETPRSIIIEGTELDVDEMIERAFVFDTATQGYLTRLIVRCGKRVFRLEKEFEDWQISEDYDT
jgi:hypothetical protein